MAAKKGYSAELLTIYIPSDGAKVCYTYSLFKYKKKTQNMTILALRGNANLPTRVSQITIRAKRVCRPRQ